MQDHQQSKKNLEYCNSSLSLSLSLFQCLLTNRPIILTFIFFSEIVLMGINISRRKDLELTFLIPVFVKLKEI